MKKSPLLLIPTLALIACSGTPRVAPPGIAQAPTSLRVTEGQEATFTVLADGHGPFQYQWKRNGKDLVGANASQLKLPQTTLADDGASFTVTITGPGGSISSSPALLSVKAAPVQVAWTCHSGFVFAWAGKVVAIDPIALSAVTRKADVIFITHGHYDHLSPKDIKAISRPDTIIVATQGSLPSLAGFPNVITVKPGEGGTAAGIPYRAVPAYNVGKAFHPKTDGNVGFLLTFGDDVLYHAGDTDLIPDMDQIQCTLALLPVSGLYTMTAAEAADAAQRLKPRLAIPMHYGSGIGSATDGETFRKLLEGKVAVEVKTPQAF